MLSVYAGIVNRQMMCQQMQQAAAVTSQRGVSGQDGQTLQLTQKINLLQPGKAAAFSVGTYQNEPTRIKSAKERKLSTEELKKLKYNFKLISAQLLRTKTSAGAAQVVTKARNKVAQLKRQIKNGEEPSEELLHAIAHAMQIQRVAEKRKKHLEQEEKMQRKSQPEPAELIEEAEQKNSQISAGQTSDEELQNFLNHKEDSADWQQKEWQDDMQAELELQMEEMAQELQENLGEDMQKMLEELFATMLEETSSMDMLSELADGLLGTAAQEMQPEELEKLKKKHRCEEQRDIMEADMKYLKAMFERLEKEKESGAGAILSGTGTAGGIGNAGAVSPGLFVSVSSQPSAIPLQDFGTVQSEGGSVDVTV